VHQPIVIGSGHAGVAAVNQLVRAGHRPIVLDAGRELDPARSDLVADLATRPPAEWTSAERDAIGDNPTAHDAMPRRLNFGSSYMYADDDAASPVRRRRPSAPVPSLAVGGYSTVWGAAMLPAADCDLAAWPIGRDDLARHYRTVLDDLPFSAGDDRLEELFPTYRDRHGALVVPPQSQRLLTRLGRDRRLRQRPDVTFGQARLAVRSDPDDPNGCTYCGQCLSGCAYGSIYRADEDLRRHARAGSIDHRPGYVVRRIEEDDAVARVHCDGPAGEAVVLEAERVFVAAGAINSTRIVLESLQAWDTPVRLLSTQGYLLPLLHVHTEADWPVRNTLATIFFEYKVPGSDHWVHVQVNAPNELVHRRLGYREHGRRPRDRVLRRGLRHALVALCNVHSDHAGHHLLTLRSDGARPPILDIDSVAEASFPAFARRATRQLTKHLWRSGVIGLVPVLGPEGGPSSTHVGGSLPMRRAPKGPFETDRLGRPAGWQRTHVVDSSVFSSVPATTVALLAMANATRIVDEAMAATPPAA
jgi:choline dehydrogenase-like flavoprotein